jgi:tRNA(Ile)-lysidine synthase
MIALVNSKLFDHYVGRGKAVILAVSGGGDSMALLDLYRRAYTKNQNLPAPYVITIDHGLRNGFEKEAALAAAYCTKIQIPWQMLPWVGEKPKTGIMAAARMARYRLLANAAKDVGASIILTGHNLDDQHETAMMRGLRGSASLMESDVLFERQSWISRPLLSLSRASLREHLTQNLIAFADDPTNIDMRYERARVRKDIAKSLPILAETHLKEDLVMRASAFVLQNVKRQDECVLISKPLARDYEAEIFALRYVSATLGGFDYPATLQVAKRISNLLDKGNNGAAYTAQRCRFMRTTAGLAVTYDPRHPVELWPIPRVQPFETFCAKKLIPLANALAQIVGAGPFLGLNTAAI